MNVERQVSGIDVSERTNERTNKLEKTILSSCTINGRYNSNYDLSTCQWSVHSIVTLISSGIDLGQMAPKYYGLKVAGGLVGG